jgi:hypothetical protein
MYAQQVLFGFAVFAAVASTFPTGCMLPLFFCGAARLTQNKVMEPRNPEPAVLYTASVLPKAEKRDAEPAVLYTASVLPKAEKRNADPAVLYTASVLPKAEKRDPVPAILYTASVLPKAEKRDATLVDESELACCLLSDTRCQKVAEEGHITKRLTTIVERRDFTEVDESELACCLIKDGPCQAWIQANAE